MASIRNRPLAATVAAALGLAVAVVAAQPAGADPAGVLRTLDWENPADRTLPATPPAGFYKQFVTDHGATMVTAPARAGGHAVRFELNRTDPSPAAGSRRAEINQPDAQPANAERWYGFSINLDPTWAYDTSSEIVTQWHQCDSGCPGGSPPLALLTGKGRWQIDFQGEFIDLGPYRTGGWTDWVFHVRWRTDGAGLLEVWRDGVQVVSRTGPVHGGGPRSPYFKLGIYKWDWAFSDRASTVDRRVMFHDEVRVGDERATYADVAPGGSGGCAGAVPVAGVSASTHEAANPPAQAVDGSLGTRWSGNGFGAALTLDLGTVRRLCGTTVAWHRGDLRWNDYTVYTSTDGVTYTKAWEGRSTGATTAPETERFTPRDARFVRVSWWNNAEGNGWASITEAAVLGP
ncbi:MULTISPECIES: heparin lyase I family protein [Polymorphospora]|uniref:Heparin lyase I family protein n=1 Tax=Polymorphospora lycopeni TaxID=3140240 RepID=A0ABV5CRT0_9ACTN